MPIAALPLLKSSVAEAFVGLAIDDEELREIGRQQREHAVGVQPDGVSIHHLGAHHRLGVGREVARAVRHLRDALHGEHHIVGGERVAVLELRIAQLQLPRIGRDQLPRCGEARHQMGMLIHLDQPVEDLGGERDVRREIVIVRVDAGDRRTDRDLQRLADCRQCAHRQRRAERHLHTQAACQPPSTVQVGGVIPGCRMGANQRIGFRCRGYAQWPGTQRQPL